MRGPVGRRGITLTRKNSDNAAYHGPCGRRFSFLHVPRSEVSGRTNGSSPRRNPREPPFRAVFFPSILNKIFILFNYKSAEFFCQVFLFSSSLRQEDFCVPEHFCYSHSCLRSLPAGSPECLAFLCRPFRFSQRFADKPSGAFPAYRRIPQLPAVLREIS